MKLLYLNIMYYQKQHYIKLTEFAKAYEYKILSKIDNYFLAFDIITKQYCTVRYIYINNEYMHYNNLEPDYYKNKEKALIAFLKLFKKLH